MSGEHGSSSTADKLARLEQRRAQDEAGRTEFFESLNRKLSSRQVPRAPLILRIEVVNLCNANCLFCTYQFQTREIETMSFDVYKQAIDQYVALDGRNLCFAPVVGEALVDKNLEEKVAYARQFPQFERIEIWTNAILLNRQRFEALVEAGINEFNVSMSGFSADEYKALYRNSNYAKVLGNLREIAGSPALDRVKFVIWCRTAAAAPDQEPDYLALKELRDFPVFFQHAMFSWHGQITQEDLPGEMFIINGPKDQNRPCLHMWTAFTVMSNGEMTVCGCTDRDGTGLPLGNIRDAPIDAHLRDGRWLEMRDSFEKGCPPEFCRGCDMYWPLTLEDA